MRSGCTPGADEAEAARVEAETIARERKARAALRKAAGESAFERLVDDESQAPYAGWPTLVAMSEEAGRAVVAERDLQPGEVAWAGQAWASVVSDNFVGTVCGHCYKVWTRDTVIC
eukprot:SAG22_NODE_2004_length_3158_cov_14.773856_1_plen_116_part_00